MPVGAGRRTRVRNERAVRDGLEEQTEGGRLGADQFLSSAHFSREYNLEYVFIPVRDDVDVSNGDPLLAKNARVRVHCWQVCSFIRRSSR
jgi:hypothetical protein